MRDSKIYGIAWNEENCKWQNYSNCDWKEFLIYKPLYKKSLLIMLFFLSSVYMVVFVNECWKR